MADPGSHVAHPVGQGLHKPSPPVYEAKYQPLAQLAITAAVESSPGVTVAFEQSSESVVLTNVVHSTHTPLLKV